MKIYESGRTRVTDEKTCRCKSLALFTNGDFYKNRKLKAFNS